MSILQCEPSSIPAGATPHQVVMMVLTILSAYHKQQAQKISQIIFNLEVTRGSPQFTQSLERQWEALTQSSQTQNEALQKLTGLITGLLDEGHAHAT